MKSMTCLELGGACEEIFSADNFDEIAKLSQEHGRQMAGLNDQDHLLAMEKMGEIMAEGGFDAWFNAKKAIFESR